MHSIVAILVLAAAPMVCAQGEPELIEKIIAEGKHNSKVWDHLTYLSEEIGPRLTTSSNLTEACAWTRDSFASFGLTNVQLWKWGEYPSPDN